MKALIIDDLKRLGGGRRSALIFADVFKELGYSPYFLTNVDKVENSAIPVAFRVNYNFKENSPGIVDLVKILDLKRQLAKIKTGDFEIRFNHHPNVFVTRGNINVLHGFSFLDPWINGNGEIVKRLPPIALRILGLYRDYGSLDFFPNSMYTKMLSKNLFDQMEIDARVGDVLYPPIFHKENDILEKKEQVVILGRISATKGIDIAVKMSNKGNFKLIIGGYLNEGDEYFLEKLRKGARNNIEIRVNISEKEKIDLLKESSTILSISGKENFGISVAEAMDFGCVPIVVRSGGPWVDLIERGKYGIGFADFDEIPDLVNRSFGYNINERVRIANSVERFSISKFRNRLREIIEMVVPNHK